MDTLWNEIAKPICTRVGSYFAGMLTAVGATNEHLQTLETACLIVGSVAVDLIVRRFNKAAR